MIVFSGHGFLPPGPPEEPGIIPRPKASPGHAMYARRAVLLIPRLGLADRVLHSTEAPLIWMAHDSSGGRTKVEDVVPAVDVNRIVMMVTGGSVVFDFPDVPRPCKCRNLYLLTVQKR